MPYYKYLIIGGGMTADSAVRGIREVDSQGSIGVVSAEHSPPYDRPPLTKGLWKGKPEEDIWRGTEDRQVDMHLGRRISQLRPEDKQAIDENGTVYSYNRLLLATGGAPHQLPFGKEHILYFRTFEDYKKLRERTQKGQRFAVIGGGFIGSELAAALAMNDEEVVIIFPEEGIGGGRFPSDLSKFLNDYYREKGVEVLAGELISGLEARGDQLVLKTKSGREVHANNVLAGIGIAPNVELALAAGLEVGDGVVVDEFLRTTHTDVYAAGDVASFFNPALGIRMRVEHEDNANTMGRVAGSNMAGDSNAYHHLPYFYSDLFDLGYEAVGDTNSKLETFSDWQDPFRKGIIYYLQ
ncbi:MAG TPA: FAD-dependent oxidoreductase, partial [Anaerolineales bacterium]|nr:FAD-dependent oxidoreductase [Anaerolineales bacterium]